MKKRGQGKRASLSQGVLSINDGDTIRNLSKGIYETRTGHITGDKVSDHGSPQSENEITCIKPRQTTPTKSVSVDRPKLLTELSLSDVEINGKDDLPAKSTPGRQKARNSGAEVIVIETNDENNMLGGEVATRSFKMQSPARVICHSPSPTTKGIVPNIKVVTSDKPVNRSLDGKYKESKSLDSKDKDGKDINSRVKDPVKAKSKTTVNTTTRESTVRKKKRYLPVQSRYKQPTVQKNDDKLRSLELSAIPSQVDGKSSNEKKPANRVHSTPYYMNSLYEVQTDDGSILDTTAFQARECQLTENTKKKNKTKKGKENKENNERIVYPESSNKSKEMKDGNGVMSQLAVDLHYNRLIHNIFTHIKAKQTFNKQEEKAKAELYTLWSVNCRLEKEIKASKLTVESKSLEIAVHQLLRCQVEGFEMLSNKLSKVIVKTSKLSDALSNTAHYLPVKNIIIKNEEGLICALDESKCLLADLGSLSRINQTKIEELALASDVLKKTLKSEVSEQKICTELLDACKTLTNQERSLQAQVLQSGG